MAERVTIQHAAHIGDIHAPADALVECARRIAVDLGSVDRVYVATILGDMETREAQLAAGQLPLQTTDAITHTLRTTFGCRAPVLHVNTACTSGASSLALARRRIAAGTSVRVAVIGFEQKTSFNTTGFTALQTLTDRPAPYTNGRSGFFLASAMGLAVLGPGPAGIVLEGAAITNDANHLTGPHREGAGARRAIEAALAQAGLSATEIECIKLNGAGTPYSDASEYNALQAVFGDRLAQVPCMCFKSSIGHLQGAAGLVETILCADALRDQVVPAVPRAMLQDRAFDLNLSDSPRALPVRNVLAVFSGMGGQNTVLVLGRSA